MNSFKCTKCGLVNFTTAPECKSCGTPYVPAAANAYAPPGGGYAPPSGFSQAAPGGAAYYELSGEVTLAGLAAGVAGGLAAGAVLAFAYSYLTSYIPFVYVNFLCTVGYVFALGSASGYLMRRGKLRNTTVGLFAVAVVGVASYYLSWAVWLSIIGSWNDIRVSAFELAAQPDALWALMQFVNEKGAWTIGSHGRNATPVTGVALWSVWAVEAVMVLAGTPYAAWGWLTADPFCESCQTWCEEEKGLLSFRPAEPAELTRRFEAKDFNFLKTLGPAQEGDFEWCQLDLHRCPHCGKTNALSVQQLKVKTDKKGKSSVDCKGLVNKLLLTDADVQHLRRVSSEVRQPQPAAAAV